MATLVGKDGVVKIGSNTIGEIRSYSLEQNMDVIEDSTMGDTDRTYTSGLKTFSGSCDVFFDDTDAGQLDVQVGDTGTISVQVEGDTSGDHKLSGSIIVTGRTITASFDGMVEASVTFQGSGALTEGTVT
jgi:predicted secreted protein